MSWELIAQIASTTTTVYTLGERIGLWRWLRRAVRNRFYRPQNRRQPQGPKLPPR